MPSPRTRIPRLAIQSELSWPRSGADSPGAVTEAEIGRSCPAGAIDLPGQWSQALQEVGAGGGMAWMRWAARPPQMLQDWARLSARLTPHPPDRPAASVGRALATALRTPGAPGGRRPSGSGSLPGRSVRQSAITLAGWPRPKGAGRRRRGAPRSTAAPECGVCGGRGVCRSPESYWDRAEASARPSARSRDARGGDGCAVVSAPPWRCDVCAAGGGCGRMAYAVAGPDAPSAVPGGGVPP